MNQNIDLPQKYSNRNGWIVCISCVVVNYIRNILVYSFGVFIAEFKMLYGNQMVELTWIATSVIAITDILAPFPPYIIRRIGKKGYAMCSLAGTLLLTIGCFASSVVDQVSWLFLTFSLTFGIGSSFIFISSTLLLNEFFPSSHRHHILASSAYVLAIPSFMTGSPFYAWIIKVTSWRIAFIIAGVKIFVFGGTCSLLFLLEKSSHENCNDKAKVVTEDETISEDSNTDLDSKWCSICKTSERICWLVATALSYAGLLCPLISLPHYMEDKGYGKLEASLPLVSRSILAMITCIAMIQIGYKFKGNLIYVSIISCLAISVLFVVWPSADVSFVHIMVLSSVFGIVGFTPFIYIYATTLEVMNMRHDIAWTSYCFFAGLGALLSPILCGALFDLTGSYDDVFYASAALTALVSLVLLAIAIPKRFRNRKAEYDNLK